MSFRSVAQATFLRPRVYKGLHVALLTLGLAVLAVPGLRLFEPARYVLYGLLCGLVVADFIAAKQAGMSMNVRMGQVGGELAKAKSHGYLGSHPLVTLSMLVGWGACFMLPA